MAQKPYQTIKTYASYFVSYLLANLDSKSINNVLNIILFGSVAKDEADKESDVDLFIETKKKTKSFEKQIEKITEDFYKSREGLVFKNKGIDNKINTILGKLKDWKKLKESIESTGIVLYGKYIPPKDKKAKDSKGKKYIIFSWDKIKKNRGAFLNKIYGFKIKGKTYKGLLESFEGKKLGKSSMMIPIEHKDEIMKLIRHYGVNAKIIGVYS